jgi:predicted transcriptional regulator
LRALPTQYSSANWSAQRSDRAAETSDDVCYGDGCGHFEWELPLTAAEYRNVRRMRILAETSSHRVGDPQTDQNIYSTTLHILLNGLPVYQGVLRNHPHDSRGSLSYLRGCRGGYGFLIHAFAEDDLLKKIVASAHGEFLRLRLAVPRETIPQGGLTVYGAESGRYPVSPTVILEW